MFRGFHLSKTQDTSHRLRSGNLSSQLQLPTFPFEFCNSSYSFVLSFNSLVFNLQKKKSMLLQSCVPSSVEVGNQDVCVSVLRSYKLQKISLHKSCGVDDDSIQSCKLCGQSESVLNLLLCDRCEEAFHVSCCKPRVVLPIDEWFCRSCAKMSELSSFTISRSIGQGIGPCQYELGPVLSPIAAMMKYPEPFKSKVRIGEAYQAQVPDWCVEIFCWSHVCSTSLFQLSLHCAIFDVAGLR